MSNNMLSGRCSTDVARALLCSVHTDCLLNPRCWPTLGSVLYPVPILHVALVIRPTAISQHCLWRTPTTTSAAQTCCSDSAQLLAGHLHPDDPQACQTQLVLWWSHHLSPREPPCRCASKQPCSSLLCICYPSRELPCVAFLARNLKVNPTTQIQAPSPINPTCYWKQCDYLVLPDGQGFLSKI